MTVFTVSKTKGSKVGDRAKYFETEQADQAGYDDYYLKDGSDTQSARFMGGALAIAGIKEGQTPEPGDYEKLFNGYRLDNGKDFLPETKRRDLEQNNRVHGYSTAFNLDKSISVFYAAASKDQQAIILRAMHDAADDTIRYAEQEGKFTARRGQAGSGGREPVKIMAASYAHITSRSVDGAPPDPHLHVHVEIANFGTTASGEILALDGMDSLFKRQAEYRALYDVAFYKRLAEAGLDIQSFENDFMGYGLQTKAVTDEQKDAHSKRRKQLLEELRDEGHASAEEKSKANLASRSSKDYEIDYDELHAGWRDSIGDLDLDAKGNRQPPTRLEVEAVFFKGRSVTTIDHLERTAAQLAIGDPRGLAAVDEKKRQIIRELGVMYCKDADKITTQDFVKMEGELLRYAIRQRYTDAHNVDDEAIRRGIERFQAYKTRENKERGKDEPFKLNAEQEKAVYHLSKGGFAIMQGAAGTGKSASLGAVQEVYKSQGYTVTGIAPSGSAAEGLGDDGIDNAQTVHQLLLQIESGKRELTSKDLLLFDEAGMADTRTLHAIAYYAEKAGAKLLLVGDGQQLEAVGSASTFSMLSHAYAAGAVELVQIARQNHPEDREISKAWLKGRPGEAWEMSKRRVAPNGRPQVIACGVLTEPDPHDDEEVRAHAASKSALLTMHREPESSSALVRAGDAYLADLRQLEAVGNNGNQVLLLADSRADVRALNEHIREARIEAGEVADDEALDFRFDLGRGQYREERLAPGDRVMFRRPDKEMGVVNGTTGKVLKQEAGALVVRLDSGTTTTVSTDYDGLELSYATTVHKSQGMTVNYSHYLAADMTSRRAAYVAGTRARESHTTYLDADRAGKIEANVQEFRSKETAIHAVQAGFEQVAVQEYQRLYVTRREAGAEAAELAEIQRRIDSLIAGEKQRRAEAATPAGMAWIEESGGFSALSESNQEKAKVAHAAWQAANPERHTFALYEYVAYVQERHAKDAARRIESDEAAAVKSDDAAISAPIPADLEARAAQLDFNARAVSGPQHGIITQIELGGERMGEGAVICTVDDEELEKLMQSMSANRHDASHDSAPTPTQAWIAQSGGFYQLSESDQKKATDAHAAWQSDNPERHTFALHEYVAYVQMKHAERVSKEEEALPEPAQVTTEATPEPDTPAPELQPMDDYAPQDDAGMADADGKPIKDEDDSSKRKKPREQQKNAGSQEQQKQREQDDSAEIQPSAWSQQQTSRQDRSAGNDGPELG